MVGASARYSNLRIPVETGTLRIAIISAEMMEPPLFGEAISKGNHVPHGGLSLWNKEKLGIKTSLD